MHRIITPMKRPMSIGAMRRPYAYDTQANPNYGFGPLVPVDPNDVISGNRIIGRDPDPFIRGEILRHYDPAGRTDSCGLRWPAPRAAPGGSATSAACRPRAARRAVASGGDLQDDEHRALGRAQQRHRIVELAGLPHGRGTAESGGLRDACKVHACAGVGGLHSSFAVTLVVDDHDCQVVRLLRPCGRQRPNPMSISPSPVITRTRRFGCANASPSPTVTALPIAPQR